jgi:hypothetical protein
MSVQVNQFSCPCGAQSEALKADPPACWKCGNPMRQWGVRTADFAPAVISAERADKRTVSGDY